MRTFALSNDVLFLDHISPLASLMGWPLIVTKEENAVLASKYYPEVDLLYWPDLEFRFKELAEKCDALVGCHFWEPSIKYLFRAFYQKEMRLIFCPHGQSDKGYAAPSLSPYGRQEAVLLYGDLMKEMLIEMKIWDLIPAFAQVGNFRFSYYEKHRLRLDKAAEIEIFSHLERSNRTLLYAPTWNDPDSSTTFFECGEKLLRELPADWNLIIKLHPFILEKNPELFYRLSAIEEQRSNFLLVREFPAIYPILERIDAYLGDYSSIGYDVLAFQKPMFFLRQPYLPPARLHACGRIIDFSANLFQSIEQGLSQAEAFIPFQAALYKKAFAQIEDIQKVINLL